MTRGYFGIGIEHTKTEHNVGTLWRSADLLGAAFVFTVHRRYRKQPSDTMKSWQNIPLWHFDTLEDLRSHLPHDCRLVGVELEPGATDIAVYEHPERCAYLLGAEDHGLTKAAIAACPQLVRLPGRRSMNVSAAGTVVLYDRHAKASRS